MDCQLLPIQGTAMLRWSDTRVCILQGLLQIMGVRLSFHYISWTSSLSKNSTHVQHYTRWCSRL